MQNNFKFLGDEILLPFLFRADYLCGSILIQYNDGQPFNQGKQ